MRRAMLASLLCAGLFPMAAAAQGTRYSGADVNRSVSGAGANPRVSGAPYPMPGAPKPPVPPLVTRTERTPPAFYPDVTTSPAAASGAVQGAAPPAPQGRADFRFGYGDSVPTGYLDRKYRIADYAHFNLVAPPAGMSWVRVGKDAVLVNMNTHTVVSAAYDLFR